MGYGRREWWLNSAATTQPPVLTLWALIPSPFVQEEMIVLACKLDAMVTCDSLVSKGGGP